MIVVTGGAGFIGSAVVRELNRRGRNDILIVDRLGRSDKWKNLVGIRYADYIHKDEFGKNVAESCGPYDIEAIVHLGACSSTTERDCDYLADNNYGYSKALCRFAVENGIRFIYASSAATYGNGENGYADDEGELEKLRPLNMYGYSKQMFDLWVRRKGYLDKTVGLKYFNVFGPNEYHKGDMSSVIFKAFRQIRATGRLELFKSYRDDYADGCQKRDFVYVAEAVDKTLFFLGNPKVNGIYNVGTGKARTWNDLAHAIFTAMRLEPCIEYIDMPDDLRDRYQYFTEAKTEKIEKAGYGGKGLALEESVADYVRNYLATDNPYLRV